MDDDNMIQREKETQELKGRAIYSNVRTHDSLLKQKKKITL